MAPNLKPLAGNQPKLLKALICILFERVFLAKFTWSGKAKTSRKLAFEKYKHLIEITYGTLVCIDESYKYATFLTNLKSKVLKYAYE